MGYQLPLCSLILVTLLLPAAESGSGVSDVGNWRCHGKKMNAQARDVWQEAVDRCRTKKSYCKYICLYQKMRFLGYNMEFLEDTTYGIIEATFQDADVVEDLKLNLRRCFKNIDDTDRSEGCVGNKEVVLCVQSSWSGACETRISELGFSEEEQKKLYVVTKKEPPGLLGGGGLLGLGLKLG